MATSLRGMISYESKNYADALRDLDEAIREDPQWPASYRYRGLALSAMGRPEQAIPDFQKVTELKPYLPAGYNQLGLAYRDLGQLERAKLNFDKAIELNPDYVRARENQVILAGKRNDRAGHWRRSI